MNSIGGFRQSKGQYLLERIVQTIEVVQVTLSLWTFSVALYQWRFSSAARKRNLEHGVTGSGAKIDNIRVRRDIARMKKNAVFFVSGLYVLIVRARSDIPIVWEIASARDLSIMYATWIMMKESISDLIDRQEVSAAMEAEKDAAKEVERQFAVTREALHQQERRDDRIELAGLVQHTSDVAEENLQETKDVKQMIRPQS